MKHFNRSPLAAATLLTLGLWAVRAASPVLAADIFYELTDQSLTLDLVLGDSPEQHFDSGLVPLVSGLTCIASPDNS